MRTAIDTLHPPPAFAGRQDDGVDTGLLRALRQRAVYEAIDVLIGTSLLFVMISSSCCDSLLMVDVVDDTSSCNGLFLGIRT